MVPNDTDSEMVAPQPELKLDLLDQLDQLDSRVRQSYRDQRDCKVRIIVYVATIDDIHKS